MRRAVTVFIVLICLFGAGLLLKVGIRQKSISPAVFLPENVLLYVHQQDFSKHYNTFFTTSLGQTIRSFNLVELALDLGFSLDVVNFLRDIQNLVTIKETDALFEEFFSNDCSLALLHDFKEKDYRNYLKKNLVLFTEPVHSAQALGVMIEKIESKYHISSTQYGKHIIYRYRQSAELVITFVSVEGQTIFTLSERTLRGLLDRYDSQGSNFAENYFFADYQRQNSQATSFNYFEVGPLTNHLVHLLHGPASPSEEADFITVFNGFTAGILSSSMQGNSIKSSITLHYNTNLVDRDILHFLHIPAEKDIHIGSSPRDTLMYFWMNTFDVRRLWNVFVKRSKINRVLLQSIEENIALTAGLPFDKLLDLFGNRFHYIFRKPSQVDPVPLPNFTMIFELIDTEKAQSTLQHLFLLNSIPHGNDIYRDIPFTYWGNEMQSGWQPVYSIYNNYLYISSSVKMQLDVITATLEGSGLTSMIPFLSVGKPLLMENNSSGFFRVKEFVDFLKDFISLGEAMYSRQNKNSEYQTKTLVYTILFPLLDSLKMYSSISSTADFENGKINIEIYLNPEDS